MKPRYARTAPRTIALKTRPIAIRQGDNSVSDEATRVALWCAPMHRAIALLLLTTSCAHSVTVLAPVADVPEGTPIVAAVSPGNVTQFQRDATLGKDGVVTGDKGAIVRLQKTDEVAVLATGGEDFGHIHVRRKTSFDLLMVGGILLLLGGLTGSLLGAGACNAGYSKLQPGCAAIGFGGAALSVGGGGVMIAFGQHGELTIKF